MGNSCSSDCYYDCCDLNYNCATNYSTYHLIIDNCYYFYYNYSWIYYTIGSIIFSIIFFVILCLLCRRRRANVMLTQPMNPMVVNTTQVSARPGYDSSRNMYGQQNMAYQQGYNQQQGYNMQQGYNQPPNPNMRLQSTYIPNLRPTSQPARLRDGRAGVPVQQQPASKTVITSNK